MEKSVQTPCGEIKFELEYKKVKNVNLRIVRGGSVHVSAPRGLALSVIERFVCEKADFILKAVERFSAMPECTEPCEYKNGDLITLFGRAYPISLHSSKRPSVTLADGKAFLFVKDTANADERRRVVEKFLAGELIRITSQITERFFPTFEALGIAYPTLKVRNMHSRWGSCHTKNGIVTFALALSEKPLPCVEYVVMHELVHLIHPNHSPAFHAEMSRLMPDWRERKKALNEGIN